MKGRGSVLVATLGSEPQVITLALDNLIEEREHVTHVIVLYTSYAASGDRTTLRDLQAEFDSYPAYQHIRLEPVPFRLGNQPLQDITTRGEAHAVLATLYKQLESLKRAGRRIHLCPAGGRKAMAMYAMLAAQVLFDDDDRLWLLVSTDELRLERRLHAHYGEASLLRVPVIPWRLSYTDKQQFVGSLPEAEREVLELVARKGWTDSEIAAKRGTTPKTTGHQLSSVFDKLRVFLGDRDEGRVDRHTLIVEFNAFFEVHAALSHHIRLGSPEKEQ